MLYEIKWWKLLRRVSFALLVFAAINTWALDVPIIKGWIPCLVGLVGLLFCLGHFVAKSVSFGFWNTLDDMG